MSLCADCIKGVRHEGTIEGKFEQIGGIDCYIATPKGDFAKDKVVLFLPDVFGMQLENAQLLADDFASNGFKTVLLDYLQGDPIHKDALSGAVPGFDIGAWFGNHGTEVTRAAIDKVVAALKEQGVTRFGATGYCFGGRYVFDLAFDNVIHVAATSHPSLLKFPADAEKYLATSQAPLLINSCTIDEQFPHEAQAIADEILGGGKYKPGYTREYFEGCTHGFAVRGDLTDPKAKAGKEGAFEKTVAFFQKHL